MKTKYREFRNLINSENKIAAFLKDFESYYLYKGGDQYRGKAFRKYLERRGFKPLTASELAYMKKILMDIAGVSIKHLISLLDAEIDQDIENSKHASFAVTDEVRVALRQEHKGFTNIVKKETRGIVNLLTGMFKNYRN